jgi:hypothetical protein
MNNSIPEERNANQGRPYPFGNWRKSSFSGSNGDCVEVAVLATSACVGIRDSKAIAGPYLRFRPNVWTTFVADIRCAHSPNRDLFRKAGFLDCHPPARPARTIPYLAKHTRCVDPEDIHPWGPRQPQSDSPPKKRKVRSFEPASPPQATGRTVVSFLVSFIYVYLRLSPSTTTARAGSIDHHGRSWSFILKSGRSEPCLTARLARRQRRA